ncbi:MAG: lytic transglycosylase domain-containing protein [Actinomycetota bacterium]
MVALLAIAALSPVRGVAAQSVDEVIATIEVDSADLRLAVSELAATEQRVAEAIRVAEIAELELDELEFAEERVIQSIPGAARAVDRATWAEQEVADDLAALAVLAYTGAPPDERLAAVISQSERIIDRERVDVLFDVVSDARGTRLDAEAKRRRDAEFALTTALNDLEALGDRIDQTEAVLEVAYTTRDQGQAAIPVLQDDVVRARRFATVVGTDLPLVVFEAYFRGARNAAADSPGCNITWPLLAAIGRVESRHGTFGGSRVNADGSLTGQIIGIPLNGENNTRVIEDTDGGALDGDTEFDRAVGPMQFIPTTWAAFARDGNGDGVADPHHLFDATRAAGAYLCRAGNLADPGTLSAAILSYNRSESYRDTVLGYESQYGAVPVR